MTKAAPEGKGQTTLARARQVVFRLMRYRSRSVKEIRVKLRDRGFDDKTRDETVRYFRDLGMLDDALFARAWITSRLRKPIGIRRIHRELTAKGIDPEIIAAELNRAKNEYNENETIRALVRRRMRQYRQLDRARSRQRLTAYLIRRGFSADEIFKVIRETYRHDRS